MNNPTKKAYDVEKIKIMNTLMVKYKELRNDFLYAFGNFYCSSGMNVSHFDKMMKTKCSHHNNSPVTDIRHYEYLIYVKNIITWLDIKLNYYNNEDVLVQSTEKKAFKTSCITIGSNITRACLHCKIPNFNNDNITNNKILSSKPDIVSNNPNESKENNQLDLEITDVPKNSDKENINEIISEKSSKNNKVVDTTDEIPNHDVARSSESEATSVEKINQYSENQITNILIENVDSDDNSISKDVENMNVMSYSLVQTVIFGENSHNKGKLNPIQNSDQMVENLSNMCLENSLTIECHSSSINDKIDETSLMSQESSFTGKRSNYETNSEHIKKKKKIIPTSHAIDNVSNNKVNTKNNDSYKVNRQSNPSITSQLQKIPKQDFDEKNSLVKPSNDNNNSFIKRISKNIYIRNSKGETKMHAACCKGNLDLVISLLLQGFNPNIKDNAGWTPMHEAVKTGQLDIVKKLIEYGAYINVPGYEYETPLQTAIKYDQFDIAAVLMQNGADTTFIYISEQIKQRLNEKKWSELLKFKQISCKLPESKHNYLLDQMYIFLNCKTLSNKIVKTFCEQFNVKLVKSILNEKQYTQVTHIIVPENKNNTWDENIENLIGIANGMFIVKASWITDSVKQQQIQNCELYEVNGTKNNIDSLGPKKSRIFKQKLYPKLFDGINVHISGSTGWKQFSLEQLKTLVLIFGGKLLKRMPNPEDCSKNLMPFHCFNKEHMVHVSTIIFYVTDSCRLIKYNMEHLKVFHISWFMESIQKYTIM